MLQQNKTEAKDGHLRLSSEHTLFCVMCVCTLLQCVHTHTLHTLPPWNWAGSHCIGQAGFKLVGVSCLLFRLPDPGVMCGSPYPARYRSSGREDSEKYLYIPNPMKDKGGFEILALLSPGHFLERCKKQCSNLAVAMMYFPMCCFYMTEDQRIHE